jgi:hypothetical protein
MATADRYFDSNSRLLDIALETIRRYGKFRHTCLFLQVQR